MSPLIKSENGWKVDKPSLIVWIITMFLGACLAMPGTYYGMKYMVTSHEQKIAEIEIVSKAQDLRLGKVELYIVEDKIKTLWMCDDIKEIKTMVTEIRLDQKRRNKIEGR